MSAAGKLLAMAKVLETPVRKKAPLKDHALPGECRTQPPCCQRPRRTAGLTDLESAQAGAESIHWSSSKDDAVCIQWWMYT